MIYQQLEAMVPVHSPTFFYNNVYPSSAPCVIHASGIYLTLNTGQKVIDSTCGAAVSAIGHGNHRVKEAIIAQLDRVEYAHPGYFQNVPALELADLLVKTTNGKMARACLVGSGMWNLQCRSCAACAALC